MASTKKDELEIALEGTKPQSLIYCGPNLKGGVLAQYATFKNGLPSHVKELVEKCPAIGKAIIPVQNLSNFAKRAGDQTSYEFAILKEIATTFKE